MSSGDGASSSSTWAFVPLNPNEDTPARRGRSLLRQALGSVRSARPLSAQSTCGDGSSACKVAGNREFRSASTILIIPATPAAAWVWPRLDLHEPSSTGSVRSRPYTAASAAASIGSPRLVPVPCASTASMSPAVRPASARAARITRSCAGPLGTVRPLVAPSEFTALPRTSASTGCPSSRAVDSLASTSTPTPSAQLVPSAAAANALQRPSAAMPPWRANSANTSGTDTTATPAASARLDSPARSERTARWTATSEDEHAVSTVIDGPWRPSA
jgi:hypothetical protein